MNVNDTPLLTFAVFTHEIYGGIYHKYERREYNFIIFQE